MSIIRVRRPRLSKLLNMNKYIADDVSTDFLQDNNDTSLTSWLEWYLATSRTGLLIDVIDKIISLAAFAMYILETYNSYVLLSDGFYEAWEVIFCLFFAFDYAIRLLGAKKKMTFICTTQTLVDLVTFFPILFVILGETHSTWLDSLSASMLVYRFLRIMRILRMLKLKRILGHLESDINKELTGMVVSTLSVILFTTGAIHLFENQRNWWPMDIENPYPYGLDYGTVLYLTVTTITVRFSTFIQIVVFRRRRCCCYFCCCCCRCVGRYFCCYFCHRVSTVVCLLSCVVIVSETRNTFPWVMTVVLSIDRGIWGYISDDTRWPCPRHVHDCLHLHFHPHAIQPVDSTYEHDHGLRKKQVQASPQYYSRHSLRCRQHTKHC